VIPLKQRNRHRPDEGIYGDCHRAAIASILEMALDEVPHFCDPTLYPEDWVMHERKWLQERGLTTITQVYEGRLADVLHTVGQMNPDTYGILGGTSRTGCGHSVVICNGEIAHDPSLDDAGIVGPMKDGWYWVTFFGAAIAVGKLAA
jgi:hypothetical protein